MSPDKSLVNDHLEAKAAQDHEEDVLDSPLQQTREQILSHATSLAERVGLPDKIDVFHRAALLANTYDMGGNDYSIHGLELTADEKEALIHEAARKWSQTGTFWWTVLLGCMGAFVHGVDQTVINGANLFYPKQLGIADNQWLLGLVNGAPYLCCFVAGAWATEPLNNWFGRRGAIFIAAFFCTITFVWMAVADSWQNLFAARFMLGFGVGIKGATVPIYIAECSPARIRGACTMTWQLWTCVGIVGGCVINLAFKDIKDPHNIVGLAWRLMFGVAGIPGLVLMIQILLVPESPRWLMSKDKHAQAYKNLLKFRPHELLAARDMYKIDLLLQTEAAVIGKSRAGRFFELFTVARNRRATVASLIMFLGQNLCGMVTIAYYSSTIFVQAGFSVTSALLASLGFALINGIFAIPAIWLIDTFGRRALLLSTYPGMFFAGLLTGFAFYIPEGTARLAIIATGIYLFCIAYSPGQGPIAFVYPAEAFPLRVRNLGMALSTAWAFFCSFVVSLTFPVMLEKFGNTGAFGFYAGWDFLIFFLILFLVPETKSLSLEELDEVFEVPTRKHALYQLRQMGWWVRTAIFRQNIPRRPLYQHEINPRSTY